MKVYYDSQANLVFKKKRPGTDSRMARVFRLSASFTIIVLDGMWIYGFSD